MKAYLLNILLAIAWAALLGSFTLTNFVAGFVLGYATIWLMQFVMGSSTYFVKVRQILALIFLFSRELVISNVRVAYSVLASAEKMSPAIVAIPLDIESDAEITLLANMITLTPGTLSLDISDDRRTLYVHGMHVQNVEQFKQDIKQGFERVVKEVFR